MTYSEQWNDYRRRRRLVWQLGILYLTTIGIVTRHSNIDPIYVFFSFAVGSAVLGMWFTSWPCPKCNQRYSGLLNAFFTSKCVNCGFPKWHLEEDKNAQPGSEVDAGNRALGQPSAGRTMKGSRGDKRMLAALIIGSAIYAAIRVALWWQAP